jgi:hypothetical protein
LLKTFDVVLDVEKELHHISMPAFTVSQSDKDSIEITFHINQDDAAFDLTDKTVQLAIKKPSGLTVYQNCSIVDAAAGETNVILSKQAFLEYGFHTGEIMLSDLDQMIVTSPFYYAVRTAVMAAQAEESINDWSALENALFNMDKKPLLIDGVPTALPEYIGQTALDTTGRRAFIAYDLTAEGWQLLAAGEGGTGGGIVYWADILNKPTAFAPAAHTHTIAEIIDLQAALDSKADAGTVGGSVNWTDVLNKPASFPADPHTHAIADVTGLQTALNGKADNADLASFAPVDHVHDFASITDKPTAYTPTAHTHGVADVQGLQAALNDKADDLHTHLKADITDFAHTHTTAEITDFAAGVAGAVPAEYLTQTEGDARYAIKGTEGGTIAAAWGDIAGTLSNQLDLQAALDAKQDEGAAPAAHTHTAANITDFGTAVAGAIPAEYLTETEGDARYMAAGAAPAAHTHTTAEITGLDTALAGKADNADLAAKADTEHTHTAAEITDFGTAVAANIPAEYLTATEGDAAYMPAGAAPAAHTHTTAEITDFAAGVAANIPAEYLTATEGDAAYMPAGAAPTAHTHEIADVTGLQAALNDKADNADLAAKADAGHTHTAANITDFGTAVAANIPAEYLTVTEGNAAYMPAGAAPTAHTHTSAEITDFAAGVAGAIPAEYLTETEGNAAYQPKGTYLTAVPLASAAAVGGGRVGNGLGMSGEYLHVKTGAGLGINAANYALQVQTTNATPAPLNFWTGTATDYAALTKDPNTLYFVTG